MTDFVLKLCRDRSFESRDSSFGTLVEKYANFITKELNIGMFIPAFLNGEVWEILEEPNKSTHTNEECQKYLEAKDKVLFEGFTVRRAFEEAIHINSKHTSSIIYQYDNEVIFFLGLKGNNRLKKIEDLVIHRVPVTDTLSKQLGL